MWLPLVIAVVAAVVGVLLALDAYGRRSHNWGATAEEIGARMTGDEWLDGGPPVRVQMTRAAWIEAPPESVWQWLAQMGRGAGWYSYDRLDNGGRPSASHIVSWVSEPRIGDAVPIGYLRHLEPGQELVWWLKGVRFLGSRFRGVTLYRVAGERDRSRLLVRMQADVEGALARPACWLYRIVDGFMARRQIVGIKKRVECYGNRKLDPQQPETGARDQFQLYHAIYATGEEIGVQGAEGAAACRQHALDDGVIETAAA